MFKGTAAVALGLGLAAVAARADSPSLGKPISESDLKTWDIAILPDGTNLPPGRGTPAEGAKLYEQQCQACHAEGGKGGGSPGAGPLVGGPPLTHGIDTGKTVQNYYAYAPTGFHYIRRARPFPGPPSLSDEH